MFDTSAIVEDHKQYMQSLRAEARQARKERTLEERELEKGFRQLQSELSHELPKNDYVKWLRAPMVAALATCTLLVF